MGKRSIFERQPRDFYPTPWEAVVPLLPHLLPGTRFMEPCAGDGALVRWLTAAGHICTLASDVEPQGHGIAACDALSLYVPFAITNPPWDRRVLHPMIEHFERSWLLFDADWMHTRQSAPFLPRLRRIVSVGRVKWIPGSKMVGKDNCCWYEFGPGDTPATFVGR